MIVEIREIRVHVEDLFTRELLRSRRAASLKIIKTDECADKTSIDQNKGLHRKTTMEIDEEPTSSQAKDIKRVDKDTSKCLQPKTFCF